MANIRRRGNSWQLTVSLGLGADGKYLKRTKTIKVEDPALLKTTKRLQDHIENEYLTFKQEVEAGEYIKPEKMTFAVFVEMWKTRYAFKQLEERTLYTYLSNLKLRILPAFKHLRLDQIKPLHILDFIESLGKEGCRLDGKSGIMASGTVQMNHRILKNIFSRAVEWKILKLNPVSEVQKPKVTSKEVQPYDEVEIQALLIALQKEPIHWRMMITLALTTGMRRGELLGLEWKHINWKTGVIEVLQSVARTIAGEAHVKEPKTKNSVRKIALPASVLEEMREYYSFRVKERDAIADAWNGGEYFFMFSHADGKAFHQERPYLWFRNFIQKNNFRYIHFHMLRHTSATILINQGEQALIISRRLGHGSISTTMNIYGHALRSADQAAADKFDNLFPIKPKEKEKKTLG